MAKKEIPFIDDVKENVENTALLNIIKRPSIGYEKNNGIRITKSAGYIPIKTQIEMLIDAGTRIELLKQGEYDYQDENFVDFDVYDPTRRLNFDLAEASEVKKKADKQIKVHQRNKYLEKKYKQAELENLQTVDTKVSTGDNINKIETPVVGGKNEGGTL